MSSRALQPRFVGATARSKKKRMEKLGRSPRSVAAVWRLGQLAKIVELAQLGWVCTPEGSREFRMVLEGVR